MEKKKIDHSFAYYKCLEKVGQNIPRFLEAPVVRMLRIRSASLKILKPLAMYQSLKPNNRSLSKKSVALGCIALKYFSSFAAVKLAKKVRAIILLQRKIKST